ncbi:MAG TPA: class I adenylate-forming enzyme family protein [Amycolatopsis sp.]|nr:class I adenylate-forming enzyme family protein [Amycolatopsis sp.]
MDFVGNLTLHDYIASHARARPESRFCLSGGRWRTWGEFERRVVAGASMLAASGVRRGDRVVVLMGNTGDCVEVMTAVQRSGAICVPCSPLYQPDEVAAVLENCEPVLLVADSANEATALAVADRVPGIRLVTESPRSRATCTIGDLFTASPAGEYRPRPDDVAVIMHTSGTTARPKGVVLTHGNLLHNATTIARAVSWRRDDVSLHFFPLQHANGGLSNLGPVLLTGAAMVLEPKFSAGRFGSLLTTHRITFTSVNATHVKFLLNTEPTAADAAHGCWRMQLGLTLDPRLWREFEARFATRCLPTYGCTESLGAVVYGSLDRDPAPGSCGRPLPGYDVTVIGEDGAELSAGETGRVRIRATSRHGLARGYWPDQQPPAGGLVTNDRGYFDDDGHLFFTDRAGDMIKRAGFNVAPAEVERVLMEQDAVADAVVVGVPDPMREETIVAFVVAERAQEPPAEAELLSALSARLATYKVPEKVIFVEELETDALGKVRRHTFRARAAAALAGSADTGALR